MNDKNYQIKILLKLIVLPMPAIDSAISLPEEAVDILVPLIKERFSSFKNEVLSLLHGSIPNIATKITTQIVLDKIIWLITRFEI